MVDSTPSSLAILQESRLTSSLVVIAATRSIFLIPISFKVRNEDIELLSNAFYELGVDVDLGNIMSVLAELFAQLETNGSGADD